MFLMSVVNFSVLVWPAECICHRWLFPSLGNSFFMPSRTPTSLDFPPSFLVSPQSPCLSLLFSLTSCCGAAGLISLSSPSVFSLECHPVLFSLSSIYMLITLTFNISSPRLFSKIQTPVTNSYYTSPLGCLTDIANVTCPELNPTFATPCLLLYL